MATAQPDPNWRSAAFTAEQQTLFNRVLLAVLLIGLGIWIGSFLFSVDGPLYSEDGYKTNLYTEFISIGVTVFIIDYLNKRRDKEIEMYNLRQRLLIEVTSQSNETAKQAIDLLRHQGWLEGEGGLLQGKNLRWANLAYAHLWRANLSNTYLRQANLRNAYLRRANLSGANLYRADLSGANLRHAILIGADLTKTIFDENTKLPDRMSWSPNVDLSRFTNPNHPDFWRSEHALSIEALQADLVSKVASQLNELSLSAVGELRRHGWLENDMGLLKGKNLYRANLQNAKLYRANLKATDLLEANLLGVDFADAKFDQETKLPDDTRWTPDTDMARFTDPNHPDFWRSDDPLSPAYRGDDRTE